MKKSKTMKIASVLLILVLVTTCFVGTTFAKYTSSATGTDTVTVAKWVVKVNDTNIAGVTNPNVSFNLFETIYDSTYGTDEADVAAERIAPGTSGAFSLKVENGSEVSAAYTIALSVAQPAGNNIPIKFYSDSTFATEVTADDEGKYTFTGSKLDPVGGNTVTETKTIYWQWDFEGDDTTLGIAAAADSDLGITVTTNITVTQVD